MNSISFMSANYVARQVQYHMMDGWMQGDDATNAYFRPLDTFEARFEEIVSDIHEMGFSAMDIWTAHLNPAWATSEHLALAKKVLQAYNMQVVSLAGYFGDTSKEVQASCRVARALNVDILGGNTGLLQTGREELITILKDHGVRFGLENHPEKTPEEILEKVGDGGSGWLGIAVDTGWFGTHGYPADQALDVLGDYVIHVHMKDVFPPVFSDPPGVTMKSIGHETCAFGRGVVPIQACVETLRRGGYKGALSIEHEPEDKDPTDDVIESYALLKQWLSS